MRENVSIFGLKKHLIFDYDTRRDPAVSIKFSIDWLQSLKQFFIIVCSQTNSDGSVLKQSHQS